MDPMNNISALDQIMAWRWPGDKPLSQPMMVRLLTHICVIRPQWDNSLLLRKNGHSFAYSIFKFISSNRDCCILIYISAKISSQWSSWYSANGLDICLAQSKQHAAIWTDDGLIFWCMYMTFCLDELASFNSVNFVPSIIISPSFLKTIMYCTSLMSYMLFMLCCVWLCYQCYTCLIHEHHLIFLLYQFQWCS